MKNILMLDKDPDEAFIVKAAFADLHIAIQLDWFIDFEQLYSHLSSSELPPDLLLLELQSPFNYGSIYLQLIKQLPKYCNLPVVMYGDLQRAADTQPSFALGATAYLPKNVPYDTLKINLQQLINWDLAEAMNWPQEDRILQG